MTSFRLWAEFSHRRILFDFPDFYEKNGVESV